MADLAPSLGEPPIDHERAAITAAMMAPLSAFVAIVVGMVVLATCLKVDSVGFAGMFAAWTIGAAVLGTVATYLLMIFFGLPAFFLLQRRGLANGWTAMLVGYAVGFLPGAFMIGSVEPMPAGLMLANPCTLTGALVGGTFWLVYQREARRRDAGTPAEGAA